MAKQPMGPIARPSPSGIGQVEPVRGHPPHLPPPMTTYTVTGTTVQPASPFTNKDAMLAFVRANLPERQGTVVITLHTFFSG